jgi:hypothetical protein
LNKTKTTLVLGVGLLQQQMNQINLILIDCKVQSVPAIFVPSFEAETAISAAKQMQKLTERTQEN